MAQNNVMEIDGIRFHIKDDTLPILQIKDLHKRYNEGKSNEVHALQGVDLDVKRGDMMAIMGASGCGKTTLLNMIGHLDHNSGGEIIIDDIDTNKLSDAEMTDFRRDNIGFIFQLFNLFPFLTAVENVETPLLLKDLNPNIAREQAKMLLRDLGMGDRLYHSPLELSGGQQQRVAVARALINEPAIILGDEPTGDLDSTTSAEVMTLFRRINKLNKQTFVLVTHNRWIAERCDYIVHMVDGRIDRVEMDLSRRHEKMKVYTAALIDKPRRIQNLSLRENIASDLRKALNVSKQSILSQELNSFIFVSGEKPNGSYDPNLVAKIEKGKALIRFSKYNKKNESKFKKFLQNNLELKETSQIVKNFIKEIDSSLPKQLDKKLTKINSDLPKTFCDLSMKSFVALWDFEENQEYRFYLPGFDFPVFTGRTLETSIDIGKAVDQLLIVNFFMTFLKPTVLRLNEMHTVLQNMEKQFSQQHYKTTDEKLQTKFELFLRILIAKLSALQELENLIRRIFNLFEIPRMSLMHYNLKSDYLDFNTTLSRISEDIKVGSSKLHEVGELIQRCQHCIRDYLDVGINNIETLNSVEEFQNALQPISELSVDLFVEAEILKIWVDFFGADLPFFSFNAHLLSEAETKDIRIDKDVILAARGLFKNYNLGRNTVYAIRGANLDIKEGEFVAIVGSSGAGKTTLLNCMASLDSPDHGSVFFRGKDLHRMKDSEKSDVRLHEMGFIFQSYALLPHFNTKENVTLPADLAGNLSKEMKERIGDLLKGVGIDQQAKQFPAQLSGGQMQRVAIARALTNAPSIIFADEPTGDLDSTTGHQVMNLLRKFHQETGTTVVIITHESDIAAYAERQIIMEDGIITRR